MCILIWTNHEILWHCLLNWNDSFGSEQIFSGKQKKYPWLTNNVLLQSSIRGSIKILSPRFLYDCLWLLKRGKITVIQMLSEFNTPVNTGKERTARSSTQKKNETRPVFEYPLLLPLSCHMPLPLQKADYLSHAEHCTTSVFIKVYPWPQMQPRDCLFEVIVSADF